MTNQQRVCNVSAGVVGTAMNQKLSLSPSVLQNVESN